MTLTDEIVTDEAVGTFETVEEVMEAAEETREIEEGYTPPDEMTPELEARLHIAAREHFMRGRPEVTHLAKQLIANGTPPDVDQYETILGYQDKGRALKVRSSIAAPPRTGPGSGHGKWVDFAVNTGIFDAQVASQMKRDDLILALDAFGALKDEDSED